MGQSLTDVATGIDCADRSASRWACSRRSTPFNFPPMVPLWFLPYAIADRQHLRPQAVGAGAAHAAAHLRADRPDRPAPGRGQPRQRRQGRGQRVLRPPAHPRASRSSGRPRWRGTSTAACADAGKRVQSLGGAKNFLIVMPDAEMDKSVANAADSAYGCCRPALPRGERRGRPWERPTSRCARASSRRPRAWCSATARKPGVTMGPVISARAQRPGARATSRRAWPRAPSCSSTAAAPSVAGLPRRLLGRPDRLRRRAARHDHRHGGDLRPGALR